MRAGKQIIGLLCLLALVGCGGGGGGGDGAAPNPADVVTQTYTRDDNGFARVRRDYSGGADAAVIAQFEDGNPADPAGYRNLIALSDSRYNGKVIIEVLAQVEGAGTTETVTRLLRLTADQSPFLNEANGGLVAASGTYFLRGQNFVWVGLDGEPIRSGSDPGGLVNLVLDFTAQTADINLRTGVDPTSQIRTEIDAKGLPFNIRTGAYGGAITVQVWDPANGIVMAVDGSLRANVGGTPAFANGAHGMATAGVYTARGTANGRAVVVDGVFFGVDPNAGP